MFGRPLPRHRSREILGLLIVCVGALIAGLLPRLLDNRPLSMPIVFLWLGMAVFALPTGLPNPDPVEHSEVAEHLTEIVVIVALMGAGLKLDRAVGWQTRSSTWRLLPIAMPLTIAATAFLGWWWIGLASATAMLLAFNGTTFSASRLITCPPLQSALHGQSCVAQDNPPTPDKQPGTMDGEPDAYGSRSGHGNYYTVASTPLGTVESEPRTLC